MPQDTLEAFVEESLRRSLERGYHPTIFQKMRQDYGLERAIEKLVESSDIQSGFARLKDLGLLDWSLEAAVIRFPGSFPVKTREYAGFRLSHAKDRTLRGRI
ncbi:MAG TPA: hypothetical protein VJ798_09315 [Rhizomicrobium sp.]|nr:hypothetical protein [Rhizomicrobium sp.]